jgi:twitching motility two-component system response regulator PilG
MRLEFDADVITIPPAVCRSLDGAAFADADDFETTLNKGIAAAKNGEREAARDFLTEAAEMNAFSEDAWMGLASISEYPEELVAFLTNVLTINPANERAEKWLAETEALLGNANVIDSQGVYAIEDIAEVPVVCAHTASPPAVINGAACPFCTAENEANTFECRSCRAVLTLSDIEAILSNRNADRETIQQAVTNMEAEWNLRDFDGRELTMLGIGYVNLRSFDEGLKYLNEALLLEPNNVILSGQINTLAIRLEEMRRQNEAHGAMVKGKNILVVDDSATVRKLTSSKLEKAGHNVTCAVDGVEALAMIAENMPDMIFLDISMPRMDGYEVCKQVRSNPATKHLPVVMISGKDGFFDKVRGRMAGTTDYITKPFGPDALMKALETYLVADENTGSEQ